MKRLCMMGLVAMLSTPAAVAGDMPAGSFAGYLTSVDVGGPDGTGFGIRGWASVNGPWFVHGEFETVTLKQRPFRNIDLRQLRVGGGLTGALNPTAMWLAKAEFIDLGDFDQSGFGIHGGVILNATPALGFMGTLGYLTTDDTDGLELNVGGALAFTREWSGVLDYRTYMGEVDRGGDFDIDEIRIGVAYTFY